MLSKSIWFFGKWFFKSKRHTSCKRVTPVWGAERLTSHLYPETLQQMANPQIYQAPTSLLQPASPRAGFEQSSRRCQKLLQTTQLLLNQVQLLCILAATCCMNKGQIHPQTHGTSTIPFNNERWAPRKRELATLSPLFELSLTIPSFDPLTSGAPQWSLAAHHRHLKTELNRPCASAPKRWWRCLPLTWRIFLNQLLDMILVTTTLGQWAHITMFWIKFRPWWLSKTSTLCNVRCKSCWFRGQCIVLALIPLPMLFPSWLLPTPSSLATARLMPVFRQQLQNFPGVQSNKNHQHLQPTSLHELSETQNSLQRQLVCDTAHSTNDPPLIPCTTLCATLRR